MKILQGVISRIWS